MDKRQYAKEVERASAPSKMRATLPLAFLIGGGICALGEVWRQLLLSWGLQEDTAMATVSVTLVALSALLTGLGLYHKLARFGGAGTLVPITGFANAMVSPALEFKAEGWVLGLGVKLFSVAGPVITYGTAASVIYGFLLWILPTMPRP